MFGLQNFDPLLLLESGERGGVELVEVGVQWLRDVVDFHFGRFVGVGKVPARLDFQPLVLHRRTDADRELLLCVCARAKFD